MKVAQYRVLYVDTDQMGVVNNVNYLRFFELGRAEWIRSRGRAYKNTGGDGCRRDRAGGGSADGIGPGAGSMAEAESAAEAAVAPEPGVADGAEAEPSAGGTTHRKLGKPEGRPSRRGCPPCPRRFSSGSLLRSFVRQDGR